MRTPCFIIEVWFPEFSWMEFARVPTPSEVMRVLRVGRKTRDSVVRFRWRYA